MATYSGKGRRKSRNFRSVCEEFIKNGGRSIVDWLVTDRESSK